MYLKIDLSLKYKFWQKTSNWYWFLSGETDKDIKTSKGNTEGENKDKRQIRKKRKNKLKLLSGNL